MTRWCHVREQYRKLGEAQGKEGGGILGGMKQHETESRGLNRESAEGRRREKADKAEKKVWNENRQKSAFFRHFVGHRGQSGQRGWIGGGKMGIIARKRRKSGKKKEETSPPNFNTQTT